MPGAFPHHVWVTRPGDLADRFGLRVQGSSRPEVATPGGYAGRLRVLRQMLGGARVMDELDLPGEDRRRNGARTCLHGSLPCEVLVAMDGVVDHG